MAALRDAPSVLNSDTGVDAWPPGFAYDLNVAIPPTTPASGHSYADEAVDGCPNQCQLPNDAALGDGFISSLAGGEAPPTAEALEGAGRGGSVTPGLPGMGGAPRRPASMAGARLCQP